MDELRRDAEVAITKLGGKCGLMESAFELPKDLSFCRGTGEPEPLPFCISLQKTPVRDTDLAVLQFFSDLNELNLNQTGVSDEGLVGLRNASKLRELGLAGTKITDAGLRHLESLTKLKVLYVGESNVTEAGLQRLCQALPDLQLRAWEDGHTPHVFWAKVGWVTIPSEGLWRGLRQSGAASKVWGVGTAP